MTSLVVGRVDEVAPSVRRVIAPNGGMMTGPGTNTYLVGDDAVACIDPGPNDSAHTDAIELAAAGRLRWILATHTHRDHSPGVLALAERTGAQVIGMSGRIDSWNDATFAPDHVPSHNELLVESPIRLRALHTPGHASNHFCYLFEDAGIVFTGDHIMNGSTVVIAPPDGDMTAYLDSLALLKDYSIEQIAPGHGDLLGEPNDVVDWIINHRLERERSVLDAVIEHGPVTLEQLVVIVYADVDPRLHDMARRSLEAHLLKLQRDERVDLTERLWRVIE